jgi:peptidyl-prolyl cis-trans isomerase B (cyclophilin B)
MRLPIADCRLPIADFSVVSANRKKIDLGIWNLEFGIWNLEFRICHLPSAICHLKFVLVIVFCLFFYFSPALAQDNKTKETKNDKPATSSSKTSDVGPGKPDEQAKPLEALKADEPTIKPSTVNKSEPFDSASIEKMAAQCVTLETEAGNIEIEFFPKEAPETARNFLNLASIGAFDTMTFSRVVKDFVIQSGNAKSRETLPMELFQRLRRTIPDEPNSIKHVRGIVSIARPEEANKATAQFFILIGPAEHLDGKFTAFGRVRNGMELVDSINQAETEGEKPIKPVRIKRAVIVSCKN